MPEGGNGHFSAFEVIASDIDHMGHVNNTVYLRWVQDAVTAFWRQNAPSGAVRSVAWVALKHEITYRCPAFLDERVDVQMLIERIVGARAYFGATIRRGATVLADVKSVWCSVDITSLRPVRLDRNVRDTFLGGSEATA
ncbi:MULTISPECIES: acyl-CoA thioesterase [Sphingomonas]|jgi:acyl-CoA thioester hydrolase|uniref:Acyl-CoA thioesterase n=1 Tax=Sphingomonas zeae TaxID=1646122 RepID=A0A7Y6EFF0_9SPHN|nr:MULTISPECIES: thioesterase family protein [Sphingomonas]MBB4050005.1 acyl-CoA thioester hydrolase [Sphingomonas zeae]MDK8184247.1 thioesterase family protein [Sphingomonas zeae]MDK8214662.1 thioesterase family protein [Sphingomonas sp. UMB7805-LC452B]NUU45713.1 acyl-CoA thioesterase [Sphingomonas zeae]